MNDDDLFDQYVNGNLDTVRAELDKLEPLDAAATAVNLCMRLMPEDRTEDYNARELSRRLNTWSSR
jgi:hypothetical protein